MRDYAADNITVGELIQQLSNFPKDWPAVFCSGKLHFNRVKDRGGIAHIEFNETEGVDYVFTDSPRFPAAEAQPASPPSP